MAVDTFTLSKAEKEEVRRIAMWAVETSRDPVKRAAIMREIDVELRLRNEAYLYGIDADAD